MGFFSTSKQSLFCQLVYQKRLAHPARCIITCKRDFHLPFRSDKDSEPVEQPNWQPIKVARFVRRFLPASRSALKQWNLYRTLSKRELVSEKGKRRLMGLKSVSVLEYTNDILKPLQRLRSLGKLWKATKIEKKDLVAPNSVFCTVGLEDNTIPIELHCTVETCESRDTNLRRITKENMDCLLLHGLLANAFAWRKIQRPLATLVGGKVVAYDRTPFGLSSRPTRAVWKGKNINPYTLEYGVVLTRQVLNNFQIENCILMGHSAGGTVALMSCLQQQEIQLPKGLVLLAPAVRISYSRTLSSKFLKRYYRSILQTPMLGRRIMRARLERYKTPQGIRELLQRNVYSTDCFDAQEVIDCYLKPYLLPDWEQAFVEMAIAFKPFDIIPQIKACRIPTLIIYGNDDNVIPKQDMMDLRDSMDDCQLQVIKECGHLPMEEKPEENSPTCFLVDMTKRKKRATVSCKKHVENAPTQLENQSERQKEFFLEKIQTLVSTKSELDTDVVSAIEEWCNFDPQQTFELLATILSNSDCSDDTVRLEEWPSFSSHVSSNVFNVAGATNSGLVPTPPSCTMETNSMQPNMAIKLKASILKEKYTFASEDWVLDVLCYYQGNMEKAEMFLLENYPIDDPNMITTKPFENCGKKENKKYKRIADYLLRRDMIRLASEQQRICQRANDNTLKIRTLIEQSRNMWKRFIVFSRIARLTGKESYWKLAFELKASSQTLSREALEEKIRRESFQHDPVLDLHGFFIEEAIFLLDRKVEVLKNNMQRNHMILECITGKGLSFLFID
eukprot:jgi/Galph1/5164/GphlegSOOS_G3887.1